MTCAVYCHIADTSQMLSLQEAVYYFVTCLLHLPPSLLYPCVWFLQNSGTNQIRCFLDAPLVIFFRRLTQAQHKMQFDRDKPSNLANLWKFHRRFHSLSNSFNIFWCCFSKSNLPSWYRLLFWFVDTEPQNDSKTVSALAETVIFISTCNHN